MFRTKFETAEEIVRWLCDATISSSEETLFWNWLEWLAIYINSLVYNWRKSAIEGIDLEFQKEKDILTIVTIKSGPNWWNASQIGKMKTYFEKAKRTLRTSGWTLNILAVNGCCYGKENIVDKCDYYKFCWQKFWEFISWEKTLYIDIIKPLGDQSRIKNNEFNTIYSEIINKLTRDFSIEYCDINGAILWEKIVKINSESDS